MNERIVKTQAGFRGRLLNVDVVEVELANGTRGIREICRHPGAAVILAQLDDGRFVFVRQYRTAIARETVEVVAGTLHPGEDPLACAHRELLEETGYRARTMEPLGVVVPAPGYTDERLHTYFARLHPEAVAPATDPDESVAVVFLTAGDIERQIASGEQSDAKSLAAWLLYRLRVAPGPEGPS